MHVNFCYTCTHYDTNSEIICMHITLILKILELQQYNFIQPINWLLSRESKSFHGGCVLRVKIGHKHLKQNYSKVAFTYILYYIPILYPDTVKNLLPLYFFRVFTCILYCVPVLCPEPEWIDHVAIFFSTAIQYYIIMMSHTKLQALI